MKTRIPAYSPLIAIGVSSASLLATPAALALNCYSPNGVLRGVEIPLCAALRGLDIFLAIVNTAIPIAVAMAFLLLLFGISQPTFGGVKEETRMP